jgi:hypothetical protein
MALPAGAMAGEALIVVTLFPPSLVPISSGIYPWGTAGVRRAPRARQVLGEPRGEQLDGGEVRKPPLLPRSLLPRCVLFLCVVHLIWDVLISTGGGYTL